MPENLSAFIQAHRMVKAASTEPFRQWRLALVVLLVTYLPLAVLWLSYALLMNAATTALYGSGDGVAGGMDPVLAQMLLSGTQSIGVFFLLFAVIGYPFIVWGMVIWWRSQSGGITLKASLKSVWWVGLIYLIPMVVSGVSALPLMFGDYGMDYASDSFAVASEPSLLLSNLVTFVSYWLIFRLAVALVTAAQEQGVGLRAGWQASASDNTLALFIALDLSVLTFLLDGAARFFANLSNARWERELENHDLDLMSLTLFDNATALGETLFITWLIFVELALVWSLAQRVRQGKTDSLEAR